MLICPHCQSALAPDRGQTVTCNCGRAYPRLSAGGVDFLQGEEFADFQFDPKDKAQQESLNQELGGISWRTDGFIIPWIRRYSRASGKSEHAITVLDCGCGSGLSVDILRDHGICAWGIDAGRGRHQQWTLRSSGCFLHSANALHLPFKSSTFDVIVSSGLVEHIGIVEENSHGYRSSRLPDCDAQRARFVSELVRVLKEDGLILIDHPNASFPVDFWHGGATGSFRWHLPRGDMLPSFAEIARYFQAADPTLRLYSLSPIHRLRFQQVRKHWYGVLLAPLMKFWLRLLDFPALSFLAGSCLNPYLVTLASRHHSVEWLSALSKEGRSRPKSLVGSSSTTP